MDESCKFWDFICTNWVAIEKSIFEQTIDLQTLHNVLLPVEYRNRVFIEITFGMCNCMELEAHKKTVIMYLSPALKRANIALMEKLYSAFNLIQSKPSNLLVAKYKPYNAQAINIDDIFNETLKYDDFGYQGSVSYDEKMNALMNIVVLIKQPIAAELLQKKTITFKHEDDKTTSRDIYLPTAKNPIDVLLMRILSEYHVLNNIGYIEMLPSDDPLITSEAVFVELMDLKNQIELITKRRNYKSCNYCNHMEYQLKLSPCADCNKAYYCCDVCKQADKENHKYVC